MAIPVWISGQVLTASDVDTWFVPLVAYKTADTSRQNVTTVSNDPDLTIPVVANAFYQFQFVLDYEGSSTANQGIKWSFGVPASSTLRYAPTITLANGTQITNGMYSGVTVATGGCPSGSGIIYGAKGDGTLFTSATPGNFVIQWAQNVSEASFVILHAQSYMMLRRIG